MGKSATDHKLVDELNLLALILVWMDDPIESDDEDVLTRVEAHKAVYELLKEIK